MTTRMACSRLLPAVLAVLAACCGALAQDLVALEGNAGYNTVVRGAATDKNGQRFMVAVGYTLGDLFVEGTNHDLGY